MTTIEKDEIREAYEEVRNDESAVTWMVLKYDDNAIVLKGQGNDYNLMLEQLGDDDRAFVFARIIVGDELSKRAKFILITWAGSNVGGIKRAKMSTDKSLVKQVIKSFAAEIMASDLSEVTLQVVRDTLIKAGGANYGTGIRD